MPAVFSLQYAITFKTPRYHDIDIDQAVSVFVQLLRPSTADVGDPKPFTYKPADPGKVTDDILLMLLALHQFVYSVII